MKNQSKDIKLVLIGGGSYGWTYKFVTDMASLPELHGMHIVLHDINPEALSLVSELCKQISTKLNAKFRIETTTSLDKALPGADFVGLTISTAGDWGNEQDHTIPAKYGIIQTVADTVGPGGWSRSLRNIPIVVDIIRKVEELAPDAWFMNYSNPMTVLTRVIQKVSKVKSMGLCHELQGFLLHAAYYLGVDWEKDFSLSMAGINHLIWILQLDVKGQNALPLLKQYFFDRDNFTPIGEQLVPEELVDGGGVCPNQGVKADFLKRTGTIPAAGDRHIVEFFSHFLKDEKSADSWGLKGTHSFAHVHGIENRKANLLELINGEKEVPLRHSHEHASRIISALLGYGELITPINTANIGQIDNLPREAVVETQALVDGNGVKPIAVGALPEDLTSYLMQHIPGQEMLAEAGLIGDKKMAIQALSMDPLVPSPEIAEKIANDVFEEFQKFLPQFNGKWKK